MSPVIEFVKGHTELVVAVVTIGAGLFMWAWDRRRTLRIDAVKECVSAYEAILELIQDRNDPEARRRAFVVTFNLALQPHVPAKIAREYSALYCRVHAGDDYELPRLLGEMSKWIRGERKRLSDSEIGAILMADSED